MIGVIMTVWIKHDPTTSDSAAVALTLAQVLRRLLLWTAVCSVSAAPSFFWAAEEYNHLAMVTGIACFIAAMTAITCTQAFERFKRRRFVRRTLYIGYGVRVLLSLAFPIGAMADLWPGCFSIAIVEETGLEGASYVGTLLITLIQGTFLNVILMIFMLLVQGFQRLFLRSPAPENCCHQCRYDLRASTTSAVCPECGTPIRAERREAA